MVQQPTFVGGVRDFLPATQIPPNAAMRLENAEVHVHGTVRRRGGLRVQYQHTASSTDYPVLAKGFFGVRGANPLIVSMYNTAALTPKLTIDQGGANQLDVTVNAPFAFDERSDCFQLLDRIYFGHAGLDPLYWTPGVSALTHEKVTPGFPGTTIPPVTTGVYFQGRGWASGDPARPDLVYFSSVLGTDGNGEANSSPFTWDREFQSFRMVTGSVEAVIPFRNAALIVFTDRGIETIEPNPHNILQTYRLTLNRDIGCINRHTIAICGEDIFFMDQEGHVRSLSQTQLDENRGVTNAPLSLSIANVIDRQVKHRLQWARAAFSRGIYWIAMPIGEHIHGREVWGYSLRDQAWVGPYFFQKDVAGGTLTPAMIGGIVGHRFRGDQERTYFLIKKTALDVNGHETAAAIKTYIGLETKDLTDESTTIPVVVETGAYSPASPRRKTWFHVEHDFRFIDAPSDGTTSMLVEVRSDETDYVTAGTKVLSPDAGPALPEDLPFYLTPYSVQTPKLSLTSITERSLSLQQRLTIRDSANKWELLTTTVSGHIDEMEFA